MKKILLSIQIMFLTIFLYGQEIDLSLSILEGYKYRGTVLNNVQWTKTSSKYSHIKKEGIVVSDIFGDKKIITLADINSTLPDSTKIARIPSSIYWQKEDVFVFYKQGRVYQYNDTKKESRVLYNYHKSGKNIDFSPLYDKVAYTIGNNLYINSSLGEVKITNTTVGEDIKNGEVVHRYEFGIVKGIFWSKSGKYLGYYIKDESKVGDYPLVDIMSRESELKSIKYPMAGMDSEEVTFAIYNTDTNTNVVVKTGLPKDQYLTNVTWGTNEKYIYIGILNRAQNHLKINKYRVKDGGYVKTLFEEKSDKYIQSKHPLKFIGKGDEFLWRSNRNGYNHIYRYDISGKLLNQVSYGNIEVKDFLGISNDEVYYSAYSHDGLNIEIYKSPLKGGISTLISKEKGVHTAMLNLEGDYIIDRWSSLNTPTQYELINTNKKGGTQILYKSTVSKKTKTHIGAIKLGKILASDGKTMLNTRTVYPYDFDKTKTYPVLIYVYNGPGVQLIQNRWLGGVSLWMNYFANKGYIVFSVDGRGSSNRGVDFEQVIYKHLGEAEMKDQIKGVEYLKTLKYVDANRISVHGWSYGGYMTINLLTSYPDVFSCGVAGGPVVDWKWYEVMYGERYMGTPQNNADGYANSSLLPKAKNLTKPLLVIHGDIDATVVLQHSMRYIKQCVDDGVQVDLFIYPQHEHNVRGKDRVHLMRKVLKYIERNNIK